MKNVDLAAKIDPIFDILWDLTIRVSHGIKEGLELGWEVGFIDVLC